MPEPVNKIRSAADSRGMRDGPPVSGSIFAEADAEGLALLVALALEVGLAEALLIALVEAEALAAGLATRLSSTPRSSNPLSSIPLSSKP